MFNVLKVNGIDTKTTSFVNVILVPFLFILNLLNSAFLYFSFGYVTAYRDCPRHWLANHQFHASGNTIRWDAFHNLVPFVQFNKREKNGHGGVLLLAKLQSKSNTPSWVLFTFYNCIGGTKWRNA